MRSEERRLGIGWTQSVSLWMAALVSPTPFWKVAIWLFWLREALDSDVLLAQHRHKMDESFNGAVLVLEYHLFPGRSPRGLPSIWLCRLNFHAVSFLSNFKILLRLLSVKWEGRRKRILAEQLPMSGQMWKNNTRCTCIRMCIQLWCWMHCNTKTPTIHRCWGQTDTNVITHRTVCILCVSAFVCLYSIMND